MTTLHSTTRPLPLKTALSKLIWFTENKTWFHKIIKIPWPLSNLINRSSRPTTTIQNSPNPKIYFLPHSALQLIYLKQYINTSSRTQTRTHIIYDKTPKWACIFGDPCSSKHLEATKTLSRVKSLQANGLEKEKKKSLQAYKHKRYNNAWGLSTSQTYATLPNEKEIKSPYWFERD